MKLSDKKRGYVAYEVMALSARQLVNGPVMCPWFSSVGGCKAALRENCLQLPTFDAKPKLVTAEDAKPLVLSCSSSQQSSDEWLGTGGLI